MDDLPRSKITGKPLTHLYLYKLILIFHDLDEIISSFRHRNSFLEYSILNETTTYRLKGLDSHPSQNDWYPINRMRMFYFFAEKDTKREIGME